MKTNAVVVQLQDIRALVLDAIDAMSKYMYVIVAEKKLQKENYTTLAILNCA